MGSLTLPRLGGRLCLEMNVIRFTPLCACVACVPRLYTEAPDVVPSDWVAPQNGWEVSPPPEDLVGEGFADGQTVPDVRLVDQHDEEVSLWQFYGKLVVLDVSTMWCAPCRELAETTQHTFETFGPDGLMYVTVLQQDQDGEPPTLEDVRSWADVYGIEAPVLADPAPSATAAAIERGQYPALLLLDRQMRVIQRVNPPTDAELLSAIEENL